MRSRKFGPTLIVLFEIAAAGCSSSATAPANGLSNGLQACTTQPAGPVSQVPPFHRSVATACSVTPASANPGWPYAADGMACTSDDQCRLADSLPARCLNGVCTRDQCLTDDDCGGGHVCNCSSHSPNSALVNVNTCLFANCRVDSDCGAGGFCMPSASLCGINGFYCHTAADTCVDAAADCPSSCAPSACTYFPDRGAFACTAPAVGEGC